MRDFQHGPIEQFRPGQMVPLDRPTAAEKVRLDALRLECLKLACRDESASLADASPTTQCIVAAREMFEFVTDAPTKPEQLKLFVVRRTMEVTGCDRDRCHLNIWGGYAHWGFAQHAFRFASVDEAWLAVGKHETALYGAGVIPAFEVEALPDGTDPF